MHNIINVIMSVECAIIPFKINPLEGCVCVDNTKNNTTVI